MVIVLNRETVLYVIPEFFPERLPAGRQGVEKKISGI